MTTPTTPVGAHPPAAGPPAPPSGGKPPSPVDRRRPVGWGVALIGLGVLWLLALAGVPLRWDYVLPGAVVGIGLLVLVTGRSRGGDGLIGLGIVLSVVALATTVVPGPPSLSAGDRTHRVTGAADVEPVYALGAGTLTLDLRDLEPTADRTEVAARVTFGELTVRVPADVTVTGDAAVVMGEIVSFGRSHAGVAPQASLHEAGPADGGPVVDLDLEVGFGRIEVTR